MAPLPQYLFDSVHDPNKFKKFFGCMYIVIPRFVFYYKIMYITLERIERENQKSHNRFLSFKKKKMKPNPLRGTLLCIYS